MTSTEIIAELAYASGVFPDEAVAEAIAQREAVTPELLQILNDVTSNITEIALQDEYMGHIFAMFLLAQFREERAYQPIVNLVSADWTYVNEALGDIVTEYLGSMLASVCNGNIDLICGLVENEELNEYVRNAGLDALVILVAQGVKTREEVMAYFQSLFQEKLERKFGFIWGSLISHCCDICAAEAVDDIDRAFADGLVDTELINRRDVQRSLRESKEKALELLASEPHCTFIDNTASAMADWPCFQPAPKPAKQSAYEQFGKPAEARTGPKVGRNDPCPCGSGKKYKKCCGGV